MFRVQLDSGQRKDPQYLLEVEVEEDRNYPILAWIFDRGKSLVERVELLPVPNLHTRR